MKAALLLCVLSASALASQPVLVRVTPETLARLQARDPMIRLVGPAEETAKRQAPPSIIGESTLLHDGENWTLVPQGAIVHLPDSMLHRVNLKPVGTLLPWSDFLAKNSSWLSTAEVSFEQAAGSEEIPHRLAAQWASQGDQKIVVATHYCGPISVKLAAADSQASLGTR